MEVAGNPPEERAEKAAHLLRQLLEFDPPADDRTETGLQLVHAKDSLQRQMLAGQAKAAPHSSPAETEQQGIEAAQRAHDRRPLSPGFRGTNKVTHAGGRLPAGRIIPAGITPELVLKFDLPARRVEREARLLAMHGGDVDATLNDICVEGGGKDARFLLAHGADVNKRGKAGWMLLPRAVEGGHLAVVEAVLDAGAGTGGAWSGALGVAAARGHTAIAALLLDRGADVHFGGDNALYQAARHGHLEVAALLLKRGAFAEPHIQVEAEKHRPVAALLLAHRAA